MKREKTRLPRFAIIAMHAEANKSDPFAGKRMELTLRNSQDDAEEVVKAARTTIRDRTARIEAEHKVWMKSDERREFVRNFNETHKPKRKPRAKAKKPMYVQPARPQTALYA